MRSGTTISDRLAELRHCYKAGVVDEIGVIDCPCCTKGRMQFGGWFNKRYVVCPQCNGDGILYTVKRSLASGGMTRDGPI